VLQIVAGLKRGLRNLSRVSVSSGTHPSTNYLYSSPWLCELLQIGNDLMRYIALLLLLVTLAGCGASYEPIEFDFRGVKIGEPYQEIDGAVVVTNNSVDANGKSGRKITMNCDPVSVEIYTLEGDTHGVTVYGDNLSNAYIGKYGPPQYTSEGRQCWRTTSGAVFYVKGRTASIMTNEFVDHLEAANAEFEKSEIDQMKL